MTVVFVGALFVVVLTAGFIYGAVNVAESFNRVRISNNATWPEW